MDCNSELFYDDDELWGICKRINGHFFHFLVTNYLPGIIDYSHLDKEIIISEDDEIKLGNIKEKNIISSTDDLYKIFEELVLAVENEFSKHGLSIISGEERQLLINQLIFDILYNKYHVDTTMTLHKYCANTIDVYYHKSIDEQAKKIMEDQEIDTSNMSEKQAEDYYQPEFDKAKINLYQSMERRIKNYIDSIDNPARKEEFIKRGMNQDNIIEYITENSKNPKGLWDFIYYTVNDELNEFKQYRYNFWGGSSEEVPKTFANELNNYDKFLEERFIKNTRNNEDYVQKTIDFYYLEVMNRFEFMHRLTKRMANDAVTNFDDCHYLVKEFSLEVTCPCVENIAGYAYLCFDKNINYYTPLLFIEENWLAKSHYKLNATQDNPFINQTLHFIRVQVYELFRYHYKFVSNNSADIANFIENHYNLLNKYYDSTKIWKSIKEEEPLSQEQKIFINNIRMIKDVIFRKFDMRNISDRLETDDIKEEEYHEIFGMSKETYEQFLHTLKKASEESRSIGGKPSNFNDEEKLLIAIERERYNRTDSGIAKSYKIKSRSTVREYIKKVENIILDDEIVKKL